MDVEIYTDGACSGNPGPGGYGGILEYDGHIKELSEGFRLTTNNRMELMAVIKALENVKFNSKIKIYTDSQYVKNGITIWITTWKNKNWRTGSNKEVKNRDLWEKLDKLVSHNEIRWEWIRGHSGNIKKEIADQLARSAIPK